MLLLLRSKMAKNIEKLAEIGEAQLKSMLEENITKIFDSVNYLAEESLSFDNINRPPHHITKIDINLHMGNYISSREEYVQMGLDPHQYDCRVLNAINGFDYLKSRFKEIIGEDENDKVSKKEIARQVCRDAKNLVEDTATKVGEVSFALASPIFGNLSMNLQERIEKISRGLYDARMSTMITYILNPVIYSVLGGYCSANYFSPNSEQEGLLGAAGIILGIVYGATESSIRAGINDNKERKAKYGATYGIASLPGKIISLPFDVALYSGGKIKDYLDEITERVERRKNL